jgi:hypothetical protein
MEDVALNYLSNWSFNVVTLFKQTAVHRSFAIADNLGEVSAKAQVCCNFSHHVTFIFFW